MPTVVTEGGSIRVPEWVIDLGSFLRWLDTDEELPEKLKVHYLNGDVWVDLDMEEMFSHSRVKSALSATLAPFIEGDDLGFYVPDGMLLANEEADMATGPDAMFISNATLAAGRVTFAAGETGGGRATRAVGTPDLVVEVVSPSSAVKDLEWLMSAYHNCGIPEYWLIDARRDGPPKFVIHRRAETGGVAVRRADGWAKSAVLGRAFRLTRDTGASQRPPAVQAGNEVTACQSASIGTSQQANVSPLMKRKPSRP